VIFIKYDVLEENLGLIMLLFSIRYLIMEDIDSKVHKKIIHSYWQIKCECQTFGMVKGLVVKYINEQ